MDSVLVNSPTHYDVFATSKSVRTLHSWAWAEQETSVLCLKVPSLGGTGKYLLSCFNSENISVLFMVHSVKCFSHFCVFWWWFHCLKCPPSIVQKCCLEFLLAKKSAMCLIEKIHVSGKIGSGRSNCVVVHEFSINEAIMCLKQGIIKENDQWNKTVYW